MLERENDFTVLVFRFFEERSARSNFAAVDLGESEAGEAFAKHFFRVYFGFFAALKGYPHAGVRHGVLREGEGGARIDLVSGGSLAVDFVQCGKLDEEKRPTGTSPRFAPNPTANSPRYC